MQVVRGHRGHTARTRCHLGLRFGVELLREKEAQDEATNGRANRGWTQGPTCFVLQYGGPMVVSVVLTEPSYRSTLFREAEDRQADADSGYRGPQGTRAAAVVTWVPPPVRDHALLS